MPSYTLRQADNGVFYIHWTEGRRSKRLSTCQKEEAKAQTFFAHWLIGEQQDATNGASFTVAELWGEYFKRHVEKNNVTSDAPASAWKNLEQHFGALKLPQFEEKNADGDDRVEQYVKLRATGKIGKRPASPATIRYELSILKACLNWCAHAKQKIIRPADIPVFELPPDSEPRDRWLRNDEIQKMVSAAAELREDPALLGTAERFVWLALETAARITAILELTWDRVDFETKVIHYNVPGRRKTKKRRASVPISNALLPVLQRAYKERTGDLVVGAELFAMERAVKAVAARAGVPDVSPHVLRHTAATHMARRGVSLWKIAGVLGNSVGMVEKVYAKHCPDGLADAVELISGGLLEPAE